MTRAGGGGEVVVGAGVPLIGSAQDLLLLTYGRKLPPGHLRGEVSDRYVAA
ncbi:hypothetical protein ABZW11_07250 [Nonomuraea sp. NPDC004580]|uniref:hypothetical protein n=1 Tax=Nonomuraea sp. NPDC004580 TaxID=3154552 RepID=UPI0033AC4D7A